MNKQAIVSVVDTFKEWRTGSVIRNKLAKTSQERYITQGRITALNNVIKHLEQKYLRPKPDTFDPREMPTYGRP